MSESLAIPQEERNDTTPARGDIDTWDGGKKIDLDKTLPSGKSVRNELEAHLSETIDKELKNHKGVEDKIKRCQKIYSGKKDKKSYPWPHSSNVSVPIARSDADAIYVREMDSIFNKQKLVLLSPKNSQMGDEEEAQLRQQENAINHYLINTLNLKEHLKPVFQQKTVSGTGVLKIRYEVKNRQVYDYASPDEEDNKGVKKYEFESPGGRKGKLVKRPSVVFKGPTVYPVSRENFLISSDATDVDEAYFCADRFWRRKQQLKSMAKRGVYDPDAVERLTTSDPKGLQKARAEERGVKIDKTKYEEPYELWECWFKYDVDGDGEEDDIVVVFHVPSKQILSAIYNPIFYNYRPYVAFKGWPIAYSFDGQGICEKLESIQAEIDTIHNQRLDRMHMLTMPMVLYRSGVGLEKFQLSPGLCQPVDIDPKDVFSVIQVPDTYASTEREETRSVGYADRDAGVTPESLGISTAERPVASETAARQEEANKKFAWWIDCDRAGIKEIIYKMLESFAQYQPIYSYVDENRQYQEVEMPRGNIRDTINVDLTVSTEVVNMGTRRDVALMKFQLVKSYSDSTLPVVQQLCVPNVPSDYKKVAAEYLQVWNRLITDVIANFDERDPRKQIVDFKSVMDMPKLIANSADVLAEQKAAQMQQEQQAQQGGGPEQGVPQMAAPQISAPQEMGGGVQPVGLMGGGQ